MTTKKIKKKKLMAALNSRIMDIGLAYINIDLCAKYLLFSRDR